MAIIGTGAAPGMMCVATKSTMRYLDTCDDILMMVYEGVELKGSCRSGGHRSLLFRI